jgi:hypothetical protein
MDAQAVPVMAKVVDRLERFGVEPQGGWRLGHVGLFVKKNVEEIDGVSLKFLEVKSAGIFVASSIQPCSACQPTYDCGVGWKWPTCLRSPFRQRDQTFGLAIVAKDECSSTSDERHSPSGSSFCRNRPEDFANQRRLSSKDESRRFFCAEQAFSSLEACPDQARPAFMKCSPSRASDSSSSNIRRQIRVAAASSGRAMPKASITNQPS